MSFSQLNRRLKEEAEYWSAFLTTKNGNSIRRFKTCTFVNLQFSFFSVPIWLGRMFMHSMTLIMALIARFLSFSEKKLLRSEIIVVPLLTASKFVLYFFGDYKGTHFLWVTQTSKPFLFLFYVKLCRCAITCETLVRYIISFREWPLPCKKGQFVCVKYQRCIKNPFSPSLFDLCQQKGCLRTQYSGKYCQFEKSP